MFIKKNDQARLNLLIANASAQGLKPQLISKHGLVALTIGGSERYIFYDNSNPNSQPSRELAKDKYATRIVMDRVGLPNIPYTVVSSTSEAISFLEKHKTIIAKPIRGQKSKNIHLITAAKQLSNLDLGNCILEKFIKGQETRFLIVKGEVKAVHLKVYDSEINNPKTVKRISIQQAAWDASLSDVAKKAAEALGLIFCAVDFLVSGEGSFILEINSAPGIDRFQNPDEGPPVDAMGLYLDTLASIHTKN